LKVDLLETSVVGTPAYADAHFSFMKALKNFERGVLKMSEEETVQQEEVQPEPTEEAKPEAPAEEPAEEVEAQVEAKDATPEDDSEEESEEEDEEESDDEEEMKSASAKVESLLKNALEKLSVDRGLVEKKKTQEEMVKHATPGELAIASNWLIPK